MSASRTKRSTIIATSMYTPAATILPSSVR